MRRLIAATLLVGVFAAPQVPVTLEAQGGWRNLFDGKTLGGWDVVGNANWSVKEGNIWASSGAGHLVTPMPYGDTQITFDFWVTPDANSGVFIRCADPKQITAMNCYEVNIFDLRPDPAYRTGGIVNVARPLVNINTGNKWNTMDVTAKGSKFSVSINGQKMVDNAENADRPRGHITLQYGAGIVRFRNIRIRTL